MQEHSETFPLCLGLDDWAAAARQAASCCAFRPDAEDEQIADEPISCYNCRYRRWLADGVCCLAAGSRFWEQQS
jgi:hypothetical protein